MMPNMWVGTRRNPLASPTCLAGVVLSRGPAAAVAFRRRSCCTCHCFVSTLAALGCGLSYVSLLLVTFSLRVPFVLVFLVFRFLSHALVLALFCLAGWPLRSRYAWGFSL